MVTIPDGYAQSTAFWTSASLPTGAATTLGHDVQGFAGTVAEAAEEMYASWAILLGSLEGATRLSSVLVKFGPTATGPSAEFGGESVSGAGDTVAPNTAYLVAKNTAFGGRQGKGRFFLPGVGAGDIGNDGSVNTGQISSLAGNLGDFFAAMITDNLPPVLLHSNSLAPTTILNFEAASRVATQRRRLRR